MKDNPKFVKCIDAASYVSGVVCTIVLGRIYEVEDWCEDLRQYSLRGLNGAYDKRRFEVMTGLLVHCINAAQSDDLLRKGCIYSVKKELDEFYRLTETGESGWDKERFEIVQHPITAIVASPSKITSTSIDDVEEERAWDYFKRARPNECKCGAPLPCHYHS